VGRALHSWLAPPAEAHEARPTTCRRIPVAPGVELLIDDRHPALRLPDGDTVLAAAVSAALAELQPAD
jgi:hypothetical protein